MQYLRSCYVDSKDCHAALMAIVNLICFCWELDTMIWDWDHSSTVLLHGSLLFIVSGVGLVEDFFDLQILRVGSILLFTSGTVRQLL